MVPMILECAHTVCAACMEALSFVKPVCCPVCSAATSGGARNHAMVEVAEAAWMDEADETVGGDVTTTNIVRVVRKDCFAPLLGVNCGEVLCDGYCTARLALPIEPVVRPCPAHGLPANLFCMQHTAMACTNCVIEHHMDHRCDVMEVGHACAAIADKLIPLLDRLAATSAALETGSASLTGAKANLVAHVEASIARFQTVADDTIEDRATTIAAARSVCDDRLKALEAQSDELAVSAGQLAACVAGGKAAIARGHPVSMAHALDSALAMIELEKVEVLPRVPLKLDIVADVGSFVRLRLYEVEADMSSVRGNGLKGFVVGRRGLENNVITVTCMDAGGMAADWVTASDVVVSIRSVGVWNMDGNVVSAVVIEPGVIEVVYAVDDEGVSKVDLNVSVCGVTLAGGPWRAVSGCRADGVHVGMLALQDATGNRGLAITKDAMHMVVSNDITHQLSVYRVSDCGRNVVRSCWNRCWNRRNGSHIRSFGSEGAGAGQFNQPLGLCTTRENTILVAEYGNKRVQEVTLEGNHVKFIGAGVINDGVWAVAIHDDVVAVGKYVSKYLCATSSRIMLFSYASGALLGQFHDVHFLCVTGMQFTADGTHLVIADDRNSNVLLITTEGVFVRYIGTGVLGGGCNDVAFNSAGDIVVADCYKHRVSVFSHVDGTMLKSWGSFGNGIGEFKNPRSLAISRNRLYVLDYNSARVQVFE
jgi:hypothetical protein